MVGTDEDRQRLRDLLLEGAASPPAVTAGGDYSRQSRAPIRETEQG